MRILQVIPYMHPSAGGPPVVVENFAREVGNLGHEAEIISTAMLCNGEQENLLKTLRGVAPTTFLEREGVFALLHQASRRCLREGIGRADLVHLHTIWNPLNELVRRECEQQRRPYVLMPHGMLDPYSLSVKRWRKAIYLWAIERRNIVTAQRLIYTTEEEARLAAESVGSLPRGIVVPLGGDAPAEHSAKLARRFFEQYPTVQDRRQILFLGRLHFKKGLDRILTVLPAITKTHPEVILTIVGDGTTQFEAALRNQIRARGLNGNVLMTGRLHGALKWGAYASAEVFVLPSRQENFALTVAEAMHMGIPVIVSDRVNTWPYVRSSGAGLVVAEQGIMTGLEPALLSVLQDNAARRLMGKSGQEYARRHLTWSGAAKSLVGCYEDVLADIGSQPELHRS